MKRTIWAILLCVALLPAMAGCGARDYKPYALAELCAKAKAGEYVSTSGVLKVPETILGLEKTYGVLLVENINQDRPFVRIGIPVGTKNNQMAPLPDDFGWADVRIRTNGGQIVSQGSAVRVSGYFGGFCGGGNADITVELIEVQ